MESSKYVALVPQLSLLVTGYLHLSQWLGEYFFVSIAFRHLQQRALIPISSRHSGGESELRAASESDRWFCYASLLLAQLQCPVLNLTTFSYAYTACFFRSFATPVLVLFCMSQHGDWGKSSCSLSSEQFVRQRELLPPIFIRGRPRDSTAAKRTMKFEFDGWSNILWRIMQCFMAVHLNGFTAARRYIL